MHSINSLRDVLSEKTSFSWGFSIIQASWSCVSMADVVFGFYKNCQSSEKKKKTGTYEENAEALVRELCLVRN